MEIELWELKNIVKAAAEEAVKKYIVAQNPTADEISERQAYREFGEGWVNSQVSLGTIKPFRKGTSRNSKKLYSRAALTELKMENRLLSAVTNY
jgi:hypothetical protein